MFHANPENPGAGLKGTAPFGAATAKWFRVGNYADAVTRHLGLPFDDDPCRSSTSGTRSPAYPAGR